MQLTSLVLPASCIFPQGDYKSDRSIPVPIYLNESFCMKIANNIKFIPIFQLNIFRKKNTMSRIINKLNKNKLNKIVVRATILRYFYFKSVLFSSIICLPSSQYNLNFNSRRVFRNHGIITLKLVENFSLNIASTNKSVPGF